eukprot:257661-Hanusia_phi.AAC.1
MPSARDGRYRTEQSSEFPYQSDDQIRPRMIVGYTPRAPNSAKALTARSLIYHHGFNGSVPVPGTYY